MAERGLPGKRGLASGRPLGTRRARMAARSVPRVNNSDGGSAGWSSSTWRLVTSSGFSGRHSATGSSISASVIAGEDDAMESGWEGRSARWRADLPPAEGIGLEAGRRAVAQLGARKIESTTAPVIFESRLAFSVLSPLFGAISGPSVARGVSFLKDKLNALFAEGGIVQPKAGSAQSAK